MLRAVLIVCLVSLAAASPAHSRALAKRETNIMDMARLLDGSPISLGSVGAIILVLLALDVIATLVLGAVFTGRSRSDYDIPFLGDLANRVYNSLDVVEGAMHYFDIEEEACKFKAVCEAETKALNVHPFVGYAINTINSKLPGLERYGAAVLAARNGEDCALIYDQCAQTWF